ncbi:(d)CMP kinase [Paramicrobacterium chengjingii]|uniref:Cytidylate kinase n=1 Tax=Paramicrobacterium chengjingii TaxID=2769067 RepID=A0ABX6YFB0_9MICO|nr:(d)CMP kinase [Microbacterium chengjingii]QPZ37095.1 (d)CMP kinase [Microbacterium chengjingii]
MAEIFVAIDGPAGSGKSSISKQAARRLRYNYLDTGAAYRALAWWVLERGMSPADSDAIVEALPDWDYDIGVDPDEYFVTVGETDITEAIREPRVSSAVSGVARVPEIREHVNALFRSIMRSAPRDGIIVEGRDITTVVAPDAPVRILLTASEEVRMARRSAELTTENATEVADQLRKRDAADSRVVDFMTAAEGVVTVDSTTLNFDQTVDAVLDVIRQQTARTTHG